VPRLVHKVEPRYPKERRKSGLQGVVKLEGVIGVDGGVSEIRVVESPAEPLSRLAIEAFREWRYEPATCDGRPVRVYITTTTTFKLHY
jgi:protein TonB